MPACQPLLPTVSRHVILLISSAVCEPAESVPVENVKDSDQAEQRSEFALIARLTGGLESRPDVTLGVGDDAAALDLYADRVHQSGAAPVALPDSPGSAAKADTQRPLLLATCDAQVAGRHFLLDVSTPEEIGHKALAVNLSDIAAMGGEPLWALVSLFIPPSFDIALLDGVYAGMRALARQAGVAIVGGNVSSTSGPFALDITLLGRVARDRMITRAGGRPGDALLLVGEVGSGIAGLLALGTPDVKPLVPLDAETLAAVRRAMVAPTPHLAEGRALAASGLVTAGLDVSDGLAADLGHLCDRSGVGAVIEAAALPIASAARRVANAYGRDPLDFALYGGDDYGLLCSVRPNGVQQAVELVRQLGTPAHIIGKLIERPASERTETASTLRLEQPDGALVPLAARGWDHLRNGK